MRLRALVDEATTTEMPDPATEHPVVEALDDEGATRQQRPGIHQRGTARSEKRAPHEEFDGLKSCRALCRRGRSGSLGRHASDPRSGDRPERPEEAVATSQSVADAETKHDVAEPGERPHVQD